MLQDSFFAFGRGSMDFFNNFLLQNVYTTLPDIWFLPAKYMKSVCLSNHFPYSELCNAEVKNTTRFVIIVHNLILKLFFLVSFDTALGVTSYVM